MISLITVFISSVVFSLVLTPFFRDLALHYGIVDTPCERKVHRTPVPRIGGLAIYLSFMLALSFAFFFHGVGLEQNREQQGLMLLLGASVAFGIGFWDDFKSLPPSIKFAAQGFSALLAYAAGFSIKAVSLTSTFTIHLGWYSLPVTIFWFLLVINAINLIDGLDGLAAGLGLFVSLVLLIICISTQRLDVALGFAALCGATLGFLKFNFNPASIFMGDSGSYFLGFMLAGLSLMGSLKSSTTVAIMIPFIALGLPLMDALFAPLRRFLMGQRLFSPDRKHLHHRLLNIGFNQKNAVLLMYAVTMLLGVLAIFLVHADDEQIALILLLFAGVLILGSRKLGYINRYFGLRRMHSWLSDIGDEIGFNVDRRSFLRFQIEIYESKDLQSLWQNISKALKILDFDMAEMYLEKKHISPNLKLAMGRLGFELPPLFGHANETAEKDLINRYLWRRDSFDVHRDVCKECLLKMELPLIGEQGQSFGSIWLVKDLCRNAINQNTLRRVEHLRRTVLGSLQELSDVVKKNGSRVQA